MDLKRVFRNVSQKLQKDFILSSEIKHSGNRGTFRESALREFLMSGRMPKKYGVGSGEIVGPAKNVSRQSDLIIYDQLDGLSFLLSDTIQVYPIESVYGVIEVKSKLSKSKLIDSLENIKSVKSLTPNERIVQKGPVMTTRYRRPSPFGMVFAYSLDSNSLDSLSGNIREWEATNPPEHWPNMIAVLGEGVIHHQDKYFNNSIHNSDIEDDSYLTHLSYKNDTLFQFYITLLDLCAATYLGAPMLRRYFDPAEQIGPYLVKHHDRIQKTGNGTDNSVYKFSLAFIDKIVQWCRKIGKLSHRELFLKQSGEVLENVESAWLDYQVYHYDPEELPGSHEIEEPIIKVENGYTTRKRLLVPSTYIEVDGETYYFSWAYVSEDDYEKIEGMTKADL